MVGLYEISHRKTGRAYIGSSVDVERRVSAHLAMLRRGVHPNAWLQRTWERDGEQAFTYRLLESCSPDNVREREAEVVDERGGALPGLFNTSPVVRLGARGTGASMSDETARAIYERAGNGAAVQELADEYGISVDSVRRLVFGRTYHDITGGKPARSRQWARGSAHRNAKLTVADVRAIRRRLRDGEGGASLAREFGVTHRAVICVRDRLTWKHVS